MLKKEEKKEEMSSYKIPKKHIWCDITIEEKYIDVLNKLDLKSEKDCIDSDENLVVNYLNENSVPTLTQHQIIKRIKTLKRESSSSLVGGNKEIPFFPQFEESGDIVEYTSKLFQFMKNHKIQNIHKFILESFKKAKNYNNLLDYFEKLQSKSINFDELEYNVIGIINTHYGPGIYSFYQMLNLQQGRMNLKQFQKRILLALYGIGNTISEEYKVAMVESKFNQGMLNDVEGNEQFSQMKAEMVLDIILNHIKKRNQKKKLPKCYKCKRLGHTAKECQYQETFDGKELISYKKKREHSKSPIRKDKRRRNDFSDEE